VHIAIDTSVLVALLNAKDLWHTQAEVLKRALVAGDFQPLYFDCAVAEAVSTATRRLREKDRNAEARTLLQRLDTLVPRERIT
jgi:predicted nucleic acid-binding protein